VEKQMNLERQSFDVDEGRPAPAGRRWPLIDSDDLTAALDPQQMQVAVKAAAVKAGAPLSSAEVERAADDSIRAMMLIRTYRVRGHLAANLDPLGLSTRELPADLTPEYHGFTGAALDRPVWLGGALGLEKATVREIVAILRANYCGNVGLEYMHIADIEERPFLQERIEAPGQDHRVFGRGQTRDPVQGDPGRGVGKIPRASKYVGTKRFGLDGGESMIPAMEAIIKYGGQYGVREIVYGMAHRGRLNMLANVMAKPYKRDLPRIFGRLGQPRRCRRFGRCQISPRHLDRPRVRRHRRCICRWSPTRRTLKLPTRSCSARSARSRSNRDDLDKHEQVLPVLIHGDAAFAGQGIVWECLGFSGIRGYNTGGCIHFIINNQIGFTTSPQYARSSPYPSDVAKGVMAPILHVNGDDPEAVTFACKLAIEFRQQFKRDVVIDMWCYRRFGHNEGDEPSFTQPLMYAVIRQHPPVSQLCAAKLEAEGVIDAGWADARRAEFVAQLEEDFESAKSYKANKADWFAGRWSGLHAPADAENARRNISTGVSDKLFDSIGRTLTTIPADLEVHKTLRRVIDGRAAMFADGRYGNLRLGDR
jgi:2-oxoglutarate dehydrogenase E1 component